MMWRFIALSCFCGLTACSDQSFFGLDEDLNGPGPSIEVTPAQLDFGIVKDGEETVLTFRIENVGKNDLSVESVELRSLGAFTLLDDDVIFGLPPGADREMDVVFSPLDPDTNDGTIIIFSDDPERRALEVPMVGFGAAPKLQIDPDPYDFGVEYVGCENDDAIRLSNVGSEVLVIDEISYDGDPSLALIPDTAPVLPLSLEPGEETHVRVAFDPESDAQFEGALQVHSNDPRGWVEGMQLGEGEYAWMGEDRFTVPEAPPVDILFAVDQSCSMDDDNARLASNFSSFISKISNKKL